MHFWWDWWLQIKNEISFPVTSSCWHITTSITRFNDSTPVHDSNMVTLPSKLNSLLYLATFLIWLYSSAQKSTYTRSSGGLRARLHVYNSISKSPSRSSAFYGYANSFWIFEPSWRPAWAVYRFWHSGSSGPHDYGSPEPGGPFTAQSPNLQTEVRTSYGHANSFSIFELRLATINTNTPPKRLNTTPI